MKEYIRHIESVKSIRRAIGHAQDLKRIEEIDERLQGIDDAGHGHVTVASGSKFVSTQLIVGGLTQVVELSKKLVEMVKRLTTKKQLVAVQMEIKRVLTMEELPVNYTEGAAHDILEFDMEGDLESYMTREGNELLEVIHGYKAEGEIIFGMNKLQDETGCYTPWNLEDDSVHFFNTESPNRTPIQFSWHQIVGVHKILGHMAKKESVLLLDSVGVGKTLQALGVMMARCLWGIKGKFPPAFSECQFLFMTVRRLSATRGHMHPALP